MNEQNAVPGMSVSIGMVRATYLHFSLNANNRSGQIQFTAMETLGRLKDAEIDDIELLRRAQSNVSAAS